MGCLTGLWFKMHPYRWTLHIFIPTIGKGNQIRSGGRIRTGLLSWIGPVPGITVCLTSIMFRSDFRPFAS